jgi:RHH-type transcriptional regulator, proline utilization regulon repressor / proline dehydrogenase / delta 1-pyrroline-5-carboxylate dehydrogenase
MTADLPVFTAPYAADDVALARQLFAEVGRLSPEREARIDAEASTLIDAVRSDSHGLGGIEDVLREYALSTREGLALMTLAEALLRVPDAATADRFIEDRLGSGDFAHHIVRSDAFLVGASSWALGMTARLLHAGETPETTLAALARRLGAPAVRAAARQAMRVMGNHFVLGQTIESAIDRAQSGSGRYYR